MPIALPKRRVDMPRAGKVAMHSVLNHRSAIIGDFIAAAQS
jgi:hypothetical protein